MEQYIVTFVNSAAKEFRDLPHEIKVRIAQEIDALQNIPRPVGIKKLSGEKDLYRIRVSDYRIVYRVFDDAKQIKVTKVRHRKDVYR